MASASFVVYGRLNLLHAPLRTAFLVCYLRPVVLLQVIHRVRLQRYYASRRPAFMTRIVALALPRLQSYLLCTSMTAPWLLA